MGKLRVLTIPPCSGPQGAGLLTEMSLCCRLLLLKAVTPQTGARLLQANPESPCSAPTCVTPCCTVEGPLASALGSAPRHHAHLPTQATTFSHVAGKPAFCRKLEGRAERGPALSSLAGPSGQVCGPAGLCALSMRGRRWA